MRTIEELKRELQEIQERESDIINLIQFKEQLKGAYSAIERNTEKLKDPNLSSDRKKYLEESLVWANTKSVPQYTERIEFYEKKLGFRG